METLLKHKLSLFDNAIDSLNESLDLYRLAEERGANRYKFAVLTTCHFVELLFKHFAWQVEPKKIVFQTKHGEQKTIGLWKCIKILQDNQLEIDDKFLADLKWIKALRNQVEHYEFSLDVAELKAFSGKIYSSILKYAEQHHETELMWHIDKTLQPVMLDLCDTYHQRLDVALSIVKQQEDHDYAESLSNGGIETHWRKYCCPQCNHETLISDDKSVTGFTCKFCGNNDSELEYACDSCSNMWPKSELRYFDYTGEGHFRHICPACLRHPDYT